MKLILSGRFPVDTGPVLYSNRSRKVEPHTQMPVFLVATKNPENDEKLADRIKQQFPSDHYEVGRGQWFVSFPGVARDLYLKLVPEYSPDRWAETAIASTMIIGLGGYWGIMSRDLWDWVSTKLRSENG